MKKILALVAFLALTMSFLTPLIFLFVGCSTAIGSVGEKASVVTPARVQAVTALATYGAVLAQPDKRPAFSQASAALTALAAQDKWDLSAAATALLETDLLKMESDEGTIALGAVPLFTDAFLPSSVDLRRNEYARAFILGAKRGLELGLGVRVGRPSGPYSVRGIDQASETRAILKTEAEATRRR